MLMGRPEIRILKYPVDQIQSAIMFKKIKFLEKKMRGHSIFALDFAQRC
jgi:hypothetical protein